MKCPYCNRTLEKEPSRKKACPFCNKFIYVRTDPKTKKRIWVTEEQRDKVDEEWRIITGTQDDYLVSQNRFNEVKEQLRKKFGKEPSNNDVTWVIYTDDGLEYLKKAQWGLYRNTRFSMAELVKKEGKLYDALELYFEVCYFDVNGALNVGLDQNNQPVSGFYGPFELSHAFIAPGIIKRIKQITKGEKITSEKAKEIFLNTIGAMGGLPCPLNADAAWKKLEGHIFDD
jgi:hypothetical protein